MKGWVVSTEGDRRRSNGKAMRLNSIFNMSYSFINEFIDPSIYSLSVSRQGHSPNLFLFSIEVRHRILTKDKPPQSKKTRHNKGNNISTQLQYIS